MFAAPDVTTADWKPVTLPGKIADAGLPASGSVWARKTVTVAKTSAGKAGTIQMMKANDYITIYWNGKKVIETNPSQPPPWAGVFKFDVPGDAITEGENVVAFRLFSAADRLGVEGKIAASLYMLGSAIDLSGPWQAKVETALPLATPEMLASLPKAPGVPSLAVPSFNYNAMIAPVTHATIKGIIWYQGEANTPRASEYGRNFPAFIADWREHFGQTLPFYFVQLPNYSPQPAEHATGTWPEMRESQSKGLALPQTGAAVTIDLGEEHNLHPRNKKTVGERLALIALAKDYGKEVVYSGPIYRSMKVEGNSIRIGFDHADGGLIAKPLPETYKPISVQAETKPLVRNSPKSQVEGFAICGEDQKWIWADAKIEGNDVIVSAPEVPKPVAVRYAWADHPIFNLYNGSDLPAFPFRTDEFPLITKDSKF